MPDIFDDLRGKVHNLIVQILDSYKQGTSFPTTPVNGERFYRTDLGREYFWSASANHWLTTYRFCLALTNYNAPSATVAGSQDIQDTSGGIPFLCHVINSNIYIEYVDFINIVNPTNDLSNYWSIAINVNGVNLATHYTFLDGIGVAPSSIAVNYPCPAGSADFYIGLTKTGSPSLLDIRPSVWAREYI